jgi:8-oxo-dGTP diphosphatase
MKLLPVSRARQAFSEPRLFSRAGNRFLAPGPCRRRSGFPSVSRLFSSGYTGGVERAQTNGSGRPGPALRFVAAALIVRSGQVLIGQRRHDQPMASLWEFPGGKIEPGESPEQALIRELGEELGIQASIGPAVTHIRHNYRHGGAVDLQFFAVREFTGEIDNRIYQQVRWVNLENLPDYEFLAADRGLIRDLAAGKLL